MPVPNSVSNGHFGGDGKTVWGLCSEHRGSVSKGGGELDKATNGGRLDYGPINFWNDTTRFNLWLSENDLAMAQMA